MRTPEAHMLMRGREEETSGFSSQPETQHKRLFHAMVSSFPSTATYFVSVELLSRPVSVFDNEEEEKR